jgi:hypothetical protein
MRIQSLSGRRPSSASIERIRRGSTGTVILLKGRKAKAKPAAKMGEYKPRRDASGKFLPKPKRLGYGGPVRSKAKTAYRKSFAPAVVAVRKPLRRKSTGYSSRGVNVVATRAKPNRTLLLAGKTGRLMGGFKPSIKGVIASAKPIAIGVTGAVAGLLTLQFVQRWTPMSPRTTNLVGLGAGLALPFLVKRPEAKVAGVGLAIVSGYQLLMDEFGASIKGALGLAGTTQFAPRALQGTTQFAPRALQGATVFRAPAAPVMAMSGYRSEDDGM